MTTKPVNKTARDRLADAYERMVTTSAMPTWDSGPDDAVFTKAYGAPVPPVSKRRSPLELLRDYATAFKEQGVSPPDLVFQTRSQGQHFYASCLAAVGTHSLGGVRRHDVVDGMCIARVMGVNLIWPEE